MATFTLTGTANDLVGDGPTRTMRGYVQPSQPVINDADANVQHYGNKALTFDETGAWTIDLLETGDMVAAYRVVIEYVDDAPGSGSPSSRQVQRAVSNYFELTADTEFGSKVDVGLVAVTTETLESVYDARDEAEASAVAAAAIVPALTLAAFKDAVVGEGFRPNGTIVRDGAGVITTMPIAHPDGSTGVYALVSKDANNAVTGFTATTTGGPVGTKTATVTIPRDSLGQVNGAVIVAVS